MLADVLVLSLGIAAYIVSIMLLNFALLHSDWVVAAIAFIFISLNSIYLLGLFTSHEE